MDLLDAALVAQRAEALEGAQRARHRLVVQTVGLRDASAKAAQDLFVEERGGRPDIALVDHETDRVRSDIDDRHRRTAGNPAVRMQEINRSVSARHAALR